MSVEPSPNPSAPTALLQRLALFVDEALKCSWAGLDFDGADIQATAARLGLIIEVTFDPGRHKDTEGVGVEAGEPWLVAADDLSAVLSGTVEYGSSPPQVHGD